MIVAGSKTPQYARLYREWQGQKWDVGIAKKERSGWTCGDLLGNVGEPITAKSLPKLAQVAQQILGDEPNYPRERYDSVWAHATIVQDIGKINRAQVPLPTPGRELTPGQRVSIGSLKNAVVVETRHDGRFALIEYTRVDSNYGRPISTPGSLGVWSWLDLLPGEADGDSALSYEGRLLEGRLTLSFDSFLHMLYHRNFNDVPVYQRDYVWTQDDQRALIRSLLQGYDIGLFVFVDNKWDEPIDVLDGKQRINAIRAFYESRLEVDGYYYHTLSWLDRHMIDRRMVQVCEFKNDLDLEKRLRIFLATNHAGVPQNEEHIAKVKAALAAEIERKRSGTL
jgi:hypothetical protein